MVVELSRGTIGFGTPACSADARPRVWLSLLIPAYEHPVGVRRILDCLYAAKAERIECLINDDSRSDAVEVAVLNHPLDRAGGVTYRRNRPALGAVANWNDLLARARGEHLLLMHHDECPERDDFFTQLQAALVQASNPDVLLLDCLLPTLGGRRLRHHMPLWMRRTLLAWSPDHLLLHNTLGPTSVVVIRRSRSLFFNPALKWLVDVDWMMRLLRLPGVSVNFARDLAVVSVPHATSITVNLRGEIPRLRFTEAQLIHEHLGASRVTRLMLPNNWIERTVSRVERVCWFLLRAVIRSTGWITGRKIPSWLRGNLWFI